MARTRLRNKLLFGYALAAMLLGVVAGVGLFASDRVGRSFHVVAEHSLPQMNALGDLRFAGLRIVASVTEFALIESEKQRVQDSTGLGFGEDFEQDLVASAKRNLAAALLEYENTLGESSIDVQTVTHIRQLGDELIAAGERVMQVASRQAGAPLLIARETFEYREQTYLQYIEALLQESTAGLEQRVATVRSATELEVYLLVFAGLFSTMIAMGAAMFVTRRVTQPLGRLTEATTEFTQGDLDVRVRPISNDEIGELAAAFNHMGEELKRTTVSRDFLDKVVSTMSEALLVVGVDFRITMCNRAAVELFGYSERELRGMSASLLLHTPAREAGASDASALLHNVNEVSECLVYNRAGQALPTLLSGAIMLDRDEMVSGAVLIVRDITDAKNAERLLIEAKDRAEYATRSKSAFLANMSHEIRTPLNGLLGNAELLAATTLDKRQQHFISTILRSGENLLQVINDILDFSKIEAGRLTVNREDFDLRELIGEAARALADSAFHKGLELVCDLPPDERLLARADAMRVRQVLTNLIGNAIKFTEHGEVLVTASRAAESSAILVEVRDSGIGLPRDAQYTIFESFTQIGAHRLGGTGLGLAVSKQLVELMGGRIGVDSEPDQGARFWFTCPQPGLVAVAPDSVATATALSGSKLLVVDANDNLRRVIAGHARCWQCDCQTFADLARAEASFGTSDQAPVYDRVLVSARMLLEWPQVEAWLARLGKARILAMGSVYEEARIESLSDLGVAGFVLKPVLRDELYTALRGAVDAPPVAAVEPPVVQSRLRAKVLVVDDNAINRFLVNEILTQADCMVELAETGRGGLECLFNDDYDIVLMDCQLPDIDGEEVTRRLRQFERVESRSRTPVIALTANALSGDRARCIEAGMDDFLSKPFRQQELIETMRYWIKRPQQRVQ